jgi:multidrug efflux system membrane fusion protein
MKKTIFILFLCAGLAGAGYWFLKNNDNTLYVVSPIIGPAVQAVYATGTVEPSVMIPVSARTGARLTALMADEGQAVKQNDTLAQLEDTDLEKSVAQLQSKLDLAQREFARKSKLHKTGAISKQAFDTAGSTLATARAAMEQAQAQQGYLKLIAPEDGRIIRRDGEVGEYIPAGQPVFTMEGQAPLRIVAEVDEEDIPLVALEQKVLISADAFPNRTFKGSVSAITPMGDPVARSYRVRVALEGETPLMTGMTAETNIILREEPRAVLLPISAVKDGQIQIVRDGKVQKQTVETGAKTVNTIEIIEGISENDLILEKEDPALKDGTTINFKIKNWTLPQ